MAIPSKDYQAPPLPFESKVTQLSPNWTLDLDTWTFLNHGAFGAALNVGLVRSQEWRYFLEEQPLRYFDRHLLPHLAHSALGLSELVQCPRDCIALLPNVTSGLNAIINGYRRAMANDDNSAHVVLWDISYGSLKKIAKHSVGKPNLTEIPFQANHRLHQLAESSDPEMVFEMALRECLNNLPAHITQPLIVLDHTTSNTALTMPVERLARVAKQILPKSLVIVDGAHGLLAQPIDIISQMPNVDFYLSNGHKWLSTPRGVAFLYGKKEHHDTILATPAVISHGVDEPDLFSRYVWDGCRDYTAALSVPVVLEYWKDQGLDKVRKQMKETLTTGIDILATYWHPECTDWPGTVTLAAMDSRLLSPMALVRLPERFGADNTSDNAKRIQDWLYSQTIEVPIKCIQGQLYVRVSCHMYNRAFHFETLAKAINSLPCLY
jgi:selenocysteine lyase/cysteine desulfurase